ncbi:unnamed protein product [Microthlaspi erraticum]|uniref:Uncharacterized protein n=1 Tax=Microthlaspi erraticum TaxID=1685480 RepID=A0A6D2JEZ3_9BRAS|nr:unnamed protein product [Microthlaspi erraticum]
MKGFARRGAELDRAEDRAESQAEDQIQEVRIWVSLSAITLRSSTSGKGKPWKDAKVHGQDGEQDQEFGEESFWFFKQEEVQGPTFPRSRSLLTTQRRLPAQEPHRASSFEPREGEDNSQQRRRKTPRPDAPARPPDSIESKQRKLNSIELRVELTWRSPCLRTPDSSTIHPYQDFSQTAGLPTTASSEHKLHQGQGSHTHFEDEEEEEEEEPQARSSEPNPVEWSAPDGRLPISRPRPSLPVLWGALRVRLIEQQEPCLS